ncbi:YopX family protein [Paenibacillus tyrfis]|uniref:YopX family protein n=1 Tax=Paenibacillus tyrfis TaxID=1501230 RepID=UPI00209FD294|nr:YopX family protein [Paenibacillus tyrfis]MCP1306423.1 YopX family protein [Paenibacillus tyrfis]
MREYKFRGRRIDTGEWVYGDLWQYQGNTWIVSVIDGEAQRYPVDPKTVGQYTGLQDSKRTEEYPNGQEIYEGDIGYSLIGRYSEPKKPFLSVVKCDKCFWDFWEVESDILHEIWPSDQFEVIGKIHDHPHLLEWARQ